MQAIYDLHSHSSASDGELSPEMLMLRAQEKGVTHLALTDHDCVTGLAEAQSTADKIGLNLINGIEFSCTWNKKTFHIVGLNIDPSNPELLTGTESLHSIRTARAQKISEKLAKQNIPNAYENLLAESSTTMITRSHFADFLLKNNHVTTKQGAFDTYLGQGKPAFVGTEWASLENTLHYIKAAGGVAVLAHPMRYKMTASWMRRFLTAFKAEGGLGIEIITGRNNPDEIRRSLHFAKQFDLYGSVGSDFHSSKNKWVELGRLAPLPINIKPIWRLF
ncbi:MAG: PHP domain-containing protein [Methyloprofundus sp.]|nr:PHP domain-containing protein [Methyloprofundus sp.]